MPRPPRPPPAEAPPAAPAEATPGDGWLTAGEYALTVREGKILARDRKGKELASVPKDVKETEPFAALTDALELLEAHAARERGRAAR